MKNFGRWVVRGAGIAAIVALAGCAGGFAPTEEGVATSGGQSRAVIAVDPHTPDNLETHNGH